MNDEPYPRSRSQKLFAGAARWLAALAVSLSPWLFGSAEPWSYLFIVLMIFVALGCWIVSMILGPPSGSSAPVLLGPLLLLGAYIGVQALPIGSTITRIVNPQANRLLHETRKTLDSIPDMPSSASLSIPDTLSVSPSATRRSLCLYISYAAVFLIFSSTITHWHQVRQISALLLISGFVLALLSILNGMSDSTQMLWFHKPRHGGTFFGTFTNRNHAGALFNMLFGLSAGMLISATAIHGAETLSLRERLLAFSTRQTSRIVLMGFTTVLMAAAVVMSLSRGASISVLLALAGYIVFILRSKKSGGHRPAIILILILAVATVWIGWAPLFARLQKLSFHALGSGDPDSRMIATASTLLLYGLFPLVGSGFGTFKHVFPLFQPHSIDFGRWNHAHNDWAQLLAEGGILGATLFIITCILWLRWLHRRWGQMIHRAQVYVLGLGIGTLAMALHSFLDYSLHKPANAWTLAALCGLITAAAGLSARTTGASPRDTTQAAPSYYKRLNQLRSPGLTVALLVLALTTFSVLQDFKGELEFARFLYLAGASNADKELVKTDEHLILEAVSSANLVQHMNLDDADTYRDISTALFAWAINPSVSRVTRLTLTDVSASTARSAVQEAPSDFLTWVWLARTQALAGKWDAAEICLEQARVLRPDHSHVTMFGTNPRRLH